MEPEIHITGDGEPGHIWFHSMNGGTRWVRHNAWGPATPPKEYDTISGDELLEIVRKMIEGPSRGCLELGPPPNMLR